MEHQSLPLIASLPADPADDQCSSADRHGESSPGWRPSQYGCLQVSADAVTCGGSLLGGTGMGRASLFFVSRF